MPWCILVPCFVLYLFWAAFTGAVGPVLPLSDLGTGLVLLLFIVDLKSFCGIVKS
jgi:hypothetical protein